MVRLAKHMFWKEESGTALIEGLVVFPLVVLVFSAFVEFGYAVHQWNQTVKATQYAARQLAVTNPVVTTFNPKTAAAAPTAADVGNSMPDDGTTWSCTGNDSQSTAPYCANGLRKIVYGSATSSITTCQPLTTAGITPAMCQLNPNIKLGNVKVSYSQTGLGYYGRPNGAVVTIKVEVTGVQLNLPVVGALLGINITIPSLPVTITSEDLTTN